MPVRAVYVIKNGKRVKMWQWGKHGAKYRSRAKAEAQGRAAYANGYKKKKRRKNG